MNSESKSAAYLSISANFVIMQQFEVSKTKQTHLFSRL